ncbi:T9SS type B sorting domain-containing protein [Maribacter sp. 4U21]|uniref:T9SS type B sorting domain-containing protein n=1 Tax=Maribacter sp. 4U21 TaxID=1889779 RepID=UPI000C15C133|nr:T9SS type B sorting domain-containing protein [Maribacter sp. 4U21]
MKILTFKSLVCILFILCGTTTELSAQLGFCGGSSGDPIFSENFGSGLTNGPALPDGTTTYNYTDFTPNDGDYTISSTTNYFDWFSVQDHTPGDNNGKSFIVNASFTAGEFYRREVSGLCENTTYEFSSWLINLQRQTGCEGNGIPVNVRFQIWDETDTNLLAQGDTGDIPNRNTPLWEQYALVFKTLPGQTSVILKMRNNSNGGCGNDLAIDDIVFRSCGDTVSVANDQEESAIILCEDQGSVTTTLTATPDFSIFTSHAYQWQESPDLLTWTDISGATTNNYTATGVNSTTFFRAKIAEDPINVNNDLCNILSDVFELRVLPIPLDAVSEGDIIRCENADTPLTVTVPGDLIVNWYDAPIGGTLLLENSTSFSPSQAGTYYAEVNSPIIACPSTNRTAVSLTINPVPQVEDETVRFCEDGSATLSADLDNATYVWNTGETTKEIVVATPGEYSVLVTDTNGCSNTKFILLEQIDLPVIQTIISDGPSIIITTANQGDFEYSIDNISYQTTPLFDALPGGRYTIYARGREDCGVVTQDFIHLVIPKFFTPNGDNINDVFQIQGVEFFNSSSLFIFNRFGKLIRSTNENNLSWDGTFQGQNLPATTYWYRLKIEDSEFKGAFMLKR